MTLKQSAVKCDWAHMCICIHSYTVHNKYITTHGLISSSDIIKPLRPISHDSSVRRGHSLAVISVNFDMFPILQIPSGLNLGKFIQNEDLTRAANHLKLLVYSLLEYI